MKHNKLYQIIVFTGILLLCLYSIAAAQTQLKCPPRNDYTLKSFKTDSTFIWDGSAPIGFPEFTGQLPFPSSTHTWQADARNIAQKSMSLIPPAVRDHVKDDIIKACDKIADRDNSSEITVDIVLKSFNELAKCSKMPDKVLNNLPKTPADLDKPRVPLNCSKNLKPEYCPSAH